MLKMC